MKYLKYDIGDTVSVKGVVKEIHIDPKGEISFLVETNADCKFYGGNGGNGYFAVSEKDIDWAVESYKAEISRLEERLKVSETTRQTLYKSLLEAKSEPCEWVKGDSHHPSKNIYSDDWRELP